MLPLLLSSVGIASAHLAVFNVQVDICVHSMKDVPTWLPDGTILPCNLIREETNDVFICKKYKTLKDLPDGAVIGSASLRRQAQLLAVNPTLKVVNFRGNVQTRLKKIENGEISHPTTTLIILKPHESFLKPLSFLSALINFLLLYSMYPQKSLMPLFWRLLA